MFGYLHMHMEDAGYMNRYKVSYFESIYLHALELERRNLPYLAGLAAHGWLRAGS